MAHVVTVLGELKKAGKLGRNGDVVPELCHVDKEVYYLQSRPQGTEGKARRPRVGGTCELFL